MNFVIAPNYREWCGGFINHVNIFIEYLLVSTVTSYFGRAIRNSVIVPVDTDLSVTFFVFRLAPTIYRI